MHDSVKCSLIKPGAPLDILIEDTRMLHSTVKDFAYKESKLIGLAKQAFAFIMYNDRSMTERKVMIHAINYLDDSLLVPEQFDSIKSFKYHESHIVKQIKTVIAWYQEMRKISDRALAIQALAEEAASQPDAAQQTAPAK